MCALALFACALASFFNGAQRPATKESAELKGWTSGFNICFVRGIMFQIYTNASIFLLVAVSKSLFLNNLNDFRFAYFSL